MQVSRNGRLDIPDSLRGKFLDFRRRLRFVKLTEAGCEVIAGVLGGYLLTYLLDRLFDTPAAVRWGIFAAAVLACGLVPAALHRWVWRRRRLDQLARLLARKHPSVGDQLLGIIELSQNESEQARSPVLVEAAIRQVAETAERRDFDDAVPKPRHKQRLATAIALGAVAAALLALTTPAATNAGARFLAPWAGTPRYTFAAVEPMPVTMIVPHGEPFAVSVRLAGDSAWKPRRAEIHLSGQNPITAPLLDGRYRFELPAQIGRTAFELKVGDYSGGTAVEPMLRPELSGLTATVELPGYLGRPVAVKKDVRGGAVTAVHGSRATFVATVSRDLERAAVDGRPRQPDGSRFATDGVVIDGERTMELTWRDRFGLAGGQPFAIAVTAAEDEAPSLVCENLPRQKVLLDSEAVAFEVRARDDFGVKQVGIEWEGLDVSLPELAKGERVIGAGGPEAESLDLAATHLGIKPQPVAMRVYVEDFRPGRERVYSPVCYFDVLDAEQHAIWITAQLGRWHRMSLEVRDRELQLHEINRELRALPLEELDDPQTRRRIETQSAAERSNARRLTNLTRVGDDLLKQAMRNPEIGVGHLERWAEMMALLKDIAGTRMPSVADLLKDAATAEKVAANVPANGGPKVGQIRASGAGEPKKANPNAKPPAAVPT
nr:hypothetical protein [Planctomycetota bacterium]